jgi:glycosyltransferase involved in cell wall biosynthesis
MVVGHASWVVCVTDRHTALLRQSYPDLRQDKFVTIPNGYDEAEWDSMTRGVTSAMCLKNDVFTITYAGTFYQHRSPYPIFRALRRLGDCGNVDLARVKIDLVGWCEIAEGRSVKSMAEEYGIGACVHIHGPVSRMESLRQLARSDLLLLLAEGLTLQIPGKTYEYLRAGRPILALTSEGALADLLRRTGGAWVVDPADGDGVVGALRDAYIGWNDGRATQEPDRAVVAEFDRRQLTRRFAELITQSSTTRVKR